MSDKKRSSQRMPVSVRGAMDSLRGGNYKPGKDREVSGSELFPIAGQIAEQGSRPNNEAADLGEALTPADIGRLVPGKGIYFGTWEPADEQGALGKVFNLYAAETDLMGEGGKRILLHFNKLASYVANLGTYQGHDVADYPREKELFAALREGSYRGEWFIPPIELLNGKNIKKVAVQSDHIYAHKDKGAFAGSFIDQLGCEPACRYFSCSYDRPDRSRVHFTRFTRLSKGSGGVMLRQMKNDKASTRLVRAELKSQAGPV